MPRPPIRAPALLVLLAPLVFAQTAAAQVDNIKACQSLAFSTEEDFITSGPSPPDGSPYISDGDLLGANHAVCLRNSELVGRFDVNEDLGLDAVDIVWFGERPTVAFSTELDSPHRNFYHGDLLTTGGAIIPNQSLLHSFQLADVAITDVGLDGLHFVGELRAIQGLLTESAQWGRDRYVRQPEALLDQMRQWQVDIWFSIEGTIRQDKLQLLDGDVLSARDGLVVAASDVVLPSSAPAGIPARGIDYGVDALTSARTSQREAIRFSTEILFRRERLGFTDGDVIKLGNGVEIPDTDLYSPFEPKADFVGTDALYMDIEPPQPLWRLFVPRLIKALRDLLS